MRFGHVAGDRFPSEIEPPLAAIQYGTVGGGDDLVGRSKDRVRVADQFDRPLPAGQRGHFGDYGLQSAAIGDGPVEVPEALRNAQVGGGAADPFQSKPGFRHEAKTPVHAGHIAIRAVPCRKDDTAGHCGLDRRQNIVAVQ